MREYPDGSRVFRTIDAWLKENRPGVLHAIAPPRGIGFPDDLVATTA